MITFCPSEMPPLAASLMGCRIQTLIDCYRTLPNAIDCYYTDQGGVLCRFGDVLLVAGQADSFELLEFADFTGVRRIEWDLELLPENTPFLSWKRAGYPILRYGGVASSLSESIRVAEDLRLCFDILCESDAQFFQEAQYLPWLSDMTRRRNHQRAEAYLLGDEALACVTAKGESCAYLSSVAVRSGKRGQGLGKRLVSSVSAALANDGYKVFTVAQSKGLIDFYIRCGFVLLPQQLTIATKEKKA